MSAEEEASWLAAIAATRDSRAFERLYDRHHRLVYGLACKMLADPVDAQDLLQKVFLHAWEKAALYDARRGSPGAWLCVITRSRCLDRLRQRQARSRKEVLLEPQVLQQQAGGRWDLDSQASDVRRRRVAQALGLLSAPQRAVTEAAYFEGLTQPEIAKRLGLPLGTVKSRMRLAMQRLVEHLRPGR